MAHRNTAAEHQEAGHAVAEQIAEPVARIERHQHARMAQDAGKPEHPDGDEPQRHDRAEQLADPRAALRLQREHADQHRRPTAAPHRARIAGTGALSPSSALSTEIAGVMAPSP